MMLSRSTREKFFLLRIIFGPIATFRTLLSASQLHRAMPYSIGEVCKFINILWLYKYKLKSWWIEIFIQHFVSTVPYRKNTVPSAVNIQYTWLRKIDNFLLYIVYIYNLYLLYFTYILFVNFFCLSIHYFKRKWFQYIEVKNTWRVKCKI